MDQLIPTARPAGAATNPAVTFTHHYVMFCDFEEARQAYHRDASVAASAGQPAPRWPDYVSAVGGKPQGGEPSVIEDDFRSEGEGEGAFYQV